MRKSVKKRCEGTNNFNQVKLNWMLLLISTWTQNTADGFFNQVLVSNQDHSPLCCSETPIFRWLVLINIEILKYSMQQLQFPQGYFEFHIFRYWFQKIDVARTETRVTTEDNAVLPGSKSNGSTYCFTSNFNWTIWSILMAIDRYRTLIIHNTRNSVHIVWLDFSN